MSGSDLVLEVLVTCQLGQNILNGVTLMHFSPLVKSLVGGTHWSIFMEACRYYPISESDLTWFQSRNMFISHQLRDWAIEKVGYTLSYDIHWQVWGDNRSCHPVFTIMAYQIMLELSETDPITRRFVDELCAIKAPELKSQVRGELEQLPSSEGGSSIETFPLLFQLLKSEVVCRYKTEMSRGTGGPLSERVNEINTLLIGAYYHNSRSAQESLALEFTNHLLKPNVPERLYLKGLIFAHDQHTLNKITGILQNLEQDKLC